MSEMAKARHWTVFEVAERFQAHEITVRRWIREGRLRPLRLGRLVRITQEELERFEREGGAA